MQPSPDRYSFNARTASSRSRVIAIALTIAIHVLIILMLLMLSPATDRIMPSERMPVTFDLMPEQAAKRETTRKKAAVSEPAARPAAPVKPQITPVPPVPPTPELPFLTLTKKDLAAADISKLPDRSADRGAGGTGTADAGKGNSAAYGPGEGPGGTQLFNAEWYRRPTNAELSTYIPPNAPPNGWGLVACRTIENYHVDNCQVLGESPLGSGLARAVRLAAWQFLVLPPRVNGRPMVGAWVRIRIEYTQGVVK